MKKIILSLVLISMAYSLSTQEMNNLKLPEDYPIAKLGDLGVVTVLGKGISLGEQV